MDVSDSAGSHEVRLIVEWIEHQPALRAILAEAELVERHLDFDGFHASFEQMLGDLAWPSTTEEGRVTLVWNVMKRIATADAVGEGQNLTDYYAFGVVGGPGAAGMWRTFAEQVIKPLFDFLDEQVGGQASVLFVLERYVHRVEWFDRDEIHHRYESAVRNGHVGEDVYDRDLQRFLFLDAGYTTQAKARSASGEADLIGGVDTDDPLICEGKLYDGDRRGKRYLAAGFHQLIKYAHDYKKTVAYLVVFNLTDHLLRFRPDGPAEAWAPYIGDAGVRVHLIVVRALPPTNPASKAGKARTVEISREDLITLDDQAGHGAAGHQTTPTESGI